MYRSIRSANQSLVANEINSSVVNINDLAKQTTDSANQVDNDAKQANQLAQELLGIVSRFKI